MQKQIKYINDTIVFHPSHLIQEDIEHQKLTMDEYIKKYNFNKQEFIDILTKNKSINANFAAKLEIATGAKKNLWLILQKQWDEATKERNKND